MVVFVFEDFKKKSEYIINKMWKHQSYLHLDFVSDALQAGDLIGHLNWHVQGELSVGKE